jgi:hypothetical protein
MTRIAILIAVVALSGCKTESKTKSAVAAAMAKMSEFADAMCACKDRACTDVVQESMTRWSADMAAKGDHRMDDRPDEAAMKKMTEIGQQYAECMTRAMMASEPPPPPPPKPAKPEVPTVVASPATVEQLLAAARVWARGAHEQLQVVDLDVFYVDADGTLDPDSGKVRIELGRATPSADDPKRRTGAPVKPAPTQPTSCMELSWTAADGWVQQSRGSCREAVIPYPRCTVPVIWKRAIAKGAPADALAVLHVQERTPRRWSFAITDEPRNVAIQYSFDDDCELVVEKP